MTTETITQAAIVTPVAGDPALQIAQIALVTPIGQSAESITIAQVALIAIDVEYQVPTFYTGFYIPALWGNPLFVERS